MAEIFFKESIDYITLQPMCFVYKYCLHYMLCLADTEYYWSKAIMNPTSYVVQHAT